MNSLLIGGDGRTSGEQVHIRGASDFNLLQATERVEQAGLVGAEAWRALAAHPVAGTGAQALVSINNIKLIEI